MLPLRSSVRNGFLRSLPQPAFEMLMREADLAAMSRGQVLQTAGEIPRFVYFPEGGIISFTLDRLAKGPAEFGLAGREGVACFGSIGANSTSPFTTIVQIGNTAAYRIPARHLRAVASRDPSLQAAMIRAMSSFLVQVAGVAVSNARHSIVSRLAALLLTCHDRLDSREIPITHDFLARMLGVQRTSVTTSLHVLEGSGDIRNTRGMVKIHDRRRLLATAGDAYLVPRAEEL